MVCTTCGHRPGESNAVYCSQCGAQLPDSRTMPDDGRVWGIYHFFNGKWSDTLRGAASDAEALRQFAMPAYASIFDPSDAANLRLALVSDGKAQGQYYIHHVHEWYELVWNTDKGRWTKGPAATDRPADDRLVISPLERG